MREKEYKPLPCGMMCCGGAQDWGQCRAGETAAPLQDCGKPRAFLRVGWLRLFKAFHRKKRMANRLLVAFLALALLASPLFAASLLTGLAAGLNDFCASLQGILPVAAMLMVVLAGVLYAAGQVMGAETRARSNVWATAALTGALMAVLIVVISPPVLSAVYGQQASCTASAASVVIPILRVGQTCNAPQCSCENNCIAPPALCNNGQVCGANPATGRCRCTGIVP